ncbi:hypothetical protein [Deinococcus humi]|uniref:Uncharacterized protein n=1 Tax=Deinococcus humi TaxID=662880 RepID=A0A7W8JV92_9DEIO|nr:hypothetical protein [Deinococcus humi]MBB5363875.1 hypothetical protein [Deinococcus humi]GGO31664.1 hypothetical protein GCM10008949_28000 [Deinococcus humi]
MAAPIRNHNGEAIAAGAFTLPAAWALEGQVVLCSAVQETCRRISYRTGYSESLAQEHRLIWMSVDGQVRLQAKSQRERGPRVDCSVLATLL